MKLNNSLTTSATYFCCVLFFYLHFVCHSLAADITISSSNNSTQSFDSNDQTLTISSGGTLEVNTSSAAAISASGTLSGLQIDINADSAQGIIATGSNSAIEVSDTASISTINLNSGIISGDINLGTSSSSSSLNLNGGSVSGNITMGNANHNIDFVGGTLSGTIDGTGSIAINSNVVVNGDIGSTTSITSLTINDGYTLDLATNNNSIVASSKLEVGSGSILNIGTGIVDASIRGSSDSVGTVNIQGNNTLQANLGTATTTLNLVSIESGTILTTDSSNIDANTISVAGTLSYGSGTITGDVEGSTNGVGTFNFNNTKTTAFSIGQVNKLSDINIADVTITAGGNIAADTIIVGSGGSGKLKTNGYIVVTRNIELNSGATLDIDHASTISGDINGSAAGYGTVQFSGGGSFSQTSALGATNKLAEIEILDNNTVLEMNYDLNADKIIIGESGGSNITLNQNSGTLGVDDDSEIKLSTGGIFNYYGGTINGTVRATSSGRGTFNIGSNYANNFMIGKTGVLEALNITSGITLTANADISSNNINIAGTLDLGDSSKTIIGDMVGSGSAIFDIGSASHILTGAFTTISGNGLILDAIDNSNAGTISASGVVSIASGTTLDINFDSDDGYISNGASYQIISGGDGSSIGVISNSDIDINSSGSNKSGLLTFSTEVSGDNLLLNVSRDSANLITSNKIAQDIYSNIDSVGSLATDELRNFQKYIDGISTTNAQRSSALESLAPQLDNSIHNTAFDASIASVKTIENRMENIRNKIFLEDDIFDDYGVWMQVFNFSAKQDNINDFSGYDVESNGFAVGVDQQIDINKMIGISASYSSANIDSKDLFSRATDVDSYQFNLYGGYNYNQYFIDGFAGIALNKYSSFREIPAMGLNALANYGGETYIAKVEAGKSELLGRGFNSTSKISMTFSRNQIDSYKEENAGSLGLEISNEKSNFVEARIGSDLKYDSGRLFGIKIQPKINFSYGYDLVGHQQIVGSNFIGQDIKFQSRGVKSGKSSFIFGGGVDIYKGEDLSLMSQYSVEKRENYQSKLLLLRLKMNF